jgi:hypothetical protein
MARLEQVLPSALAGVIAKIAEKFARGLGAIREPARLLIALAWSFPLWLSICLGIWSVAVPSGCDSVHRLVLLLALLVLGVAVPTPARSADFTRPSASARRCSSRAQDAAVGAAIVLHLFSILPRSPGPRLRGAGRLERRRHAAARGSGRAGPHR